LFISEKRGREFFRCGRWCKIDFSKILVCPHVQILNSEGAVAVRDERTGVEDIGNHLGETRPRIKMAWAP